MTTVTVSTTSALITAMTKAAPGDTILMAPGRYDGVNNYNRPVTVGAPGITVTSQDPTHPASFINFFLDHLNNVTFRKVDFDTTPPLSTRPVFSLSASNNIVFDSVHIHGDLAAPDITKYLATAAGGLSIRQCSNVKLVNSLLERIPNGVFHQDCQGLTFQNNILRDIRSNGFYGGGSSNVLMDKNSMTNFWPESSADHPDYIQFWTINTLAAAQSIAITNNSLTRGIGGHAQGIFMAIDTAFQLPPVGVKITGNTITGSSWRAISVGGGSNVEIGKNIVGEGVPWIDPLAPGAQVITSAWITADGVKGLNVHDNWADAYMLGLEPNGACDGVVLLRNSLNSPGKIGA